MHLKLAHLILAHAHVEQLDRLIKRIQHPHTDIYLHIDAKVDLKKFDRIKKNSNVYFIRQRSEVRWGTYSLIEATLNSMLEILAGNHAYSHINLLSAQDYPLKPADEIYRFFIANCGKTFMDMPVIGEGWPQGAHRTVNYNFGDYLFPGHYVLQYIVNFMRIKKKVPKELDLFGRSQWFAITPECVNYVNDYLLQHPKMKKYFRMSFAPDEFLFQTILGSSPLKNRLINDNLRYINFPDGSLHPATLTVADAILLTMSGKFYARKFDSKADSIILNYLDWMIDFGGDQQSKEYQWAQHIFNK